MFERYERVKKKGAVVFKRVHNLLEKPPNGTKADQRGDRGIT